MNPRFVSDVGRDLRHVQRVVEDTHTSPSASVRRALNATQATKSIYGVRLRTGEFDAIHYLQVLRKVCADGASLVSQLVVDSTTAALMEFSMVRATPLGSVLINVPPGDREDTVIFP